MQRGAAEETRARGAARGARVGRAQPRGKRGRERAGGAPAGRTAARRGSATVMLRKARADMMGRCGGRRAGVGQMRQRATLSDTAARPRGGAPPQRARAGALGCHANARAHGPRARARGQARALTQTGGGGGRNNGARSTGARGAAQCRRRAAAGPGACTHRVGTGCRSAHESGELWSCAGATRLRAWRCGRAVLAWVNA
jgi:hypothetical protein